MKNSNLFLLNSTFTVTITYFTLLSARGSPIGSSLPPSLDDFSTVSETSNFSSNAGDNDDVTSSLHCDPLELSLSDVTVLSNGDLILTADNITIPSSNYQIDNRTVFVCLPSNTNKSDKREALDCGEKFIYNEGEYTIFPNKSAFVDGDLVPEEEYELDKGILYICFADYESPPSGTSLRDVSIKIGWAGSAISIISLLLHLLTFVFLPALRNLPGYNLASLGVAFLLAYCFVLIGQIPQVLGLSCVISSILQQYFFLVAFFCMNVLAFDVWRMLKHATQKLVIGSQNTLKKQFILYSLYAWGMPLIITSISVIVDNVKGVPPDIKPDYGKDDFCWLNNVLPRAIFFAVPAFALFVINAIFFIMSSFMIFSNTMKISMDQTKQTMKLNYVLYVRLALMMGLTWLVGIIGIVFKEEIIWLIFDLLNSLQGLFLFVFFTCTKKVYKQIAERSNIFMLSSVKPTTVTSSSTSTSGKNCSEKSVSMKF